MFVAPIHGKGVGVILKVKVGTAVLLEFAKTSLIYYIFPQHENNTHSYIQSTKTTCISIHIRVHVLFSYW